MTTRNLEDKLSAMKYLQNKGVSFGLGLSLGAGFIHGVTEGVIGGYDKVDHLPSETAIPSYVFAATTAIISVPANNKSLTGSALVDEALAGTKSALTGVGGYACYSAGYIGGYLLSKLV